MTEIVVCSTVDFPRGSRRLVKVGLRNIAVYNVSGRYFAIDNACYHHGGPLLNGDIEEVGGHPCVKCPWHSYKIALDTGEGLYWGVDVDAAAGGAPRPVLKSKGPKQRVHRTFVRGSDVVCLVDVDGTTFESDTYAEMPIANREEATPKNSLGVAGGGGPRIHSGFADGSRSGAVLNNPSKFSVSSASGTDWSRSSGSAKTRVRLIRASPACEDGTVCTFTFERTSVGEKRNVEAGQWVELALPIGPPIGQVSRQWTVTHVKGPLGGWFSCTVKRRDDGEGGSRWLHSEAALLAGGIEVMSIGGTFNFKSLLPTIVSKRGRILIVTAGIGITPAYASLAAHASDPFATISGPSLNITHLHSERHLTQMPFSEELSQLHGAYSRGVEGGEAFVYRLNVWCSQPPPESCRTRQLLAEVALNQRRLVAADVVSAVTGLAGTEGASTVHVMLCGPTEFMTFVRGVCESIGVAAVFSESF